MSLKDELIQQIMTSDHWEELYTEYAIIGLKKQPTKELKALVEKYCEN